MPLEASTADVHISPISGKVAGRLGAQLVAEGVEAEGVEAEAALAILNTLGVTFGQGHLLGRPQLVIASRQSASAPLRRRADNG